MQQIKNRQQGSDSGPGGSTVCCFGELLLRMSPELNGKWIGQSSMPAYIGGAELNVASALASWEIPTRYFTVLPDNYLSEEIINEIRKRGIDLSRIQFSGHRIGIYYLPQGADLKNAGVIYDRAHSSFSELKPGEIDWDNLFDGCTWFHFSAINPALNANAAAVCLEALKAASSKGLTISCDLNYRSKLWQYGKKPTEVMPELIEYCNVLMGNVWAAESLLGIKSSIINSENKSKEELIDAAGTSMKQIHLAYPRIQSMAYTFRLEKTYFGVLQHGSARAISHEITLNKIIDKVGSGDCFMAGLIYGLYNDHPVQQIIDFAAAAAVGKLTEKGDATRQTVETINQTISKEWKEMNS